MDSMRSLNTSLPKSTPRARRHGPPEQLLQAFRSAALSVTTLYKMAAVDQAQIHQTGYQEALDDLLGFLDHENLGLGDGEGWRVRQWATERLDGTQASGESDDDKVENDARARSSSPIVARKEPQADQDRTRLAARSASPVRATASSTTPTISTLPQPQPSSLPAEPFTFRSSVPYPTQRDMDMPSSDPDLPSPASASRSSQAPTPERHSSAAASNKPEITLRHPRHHRQSGNVGRSNGRTSTPLGTLGNGVGTKRRLPFGDFFDISMTNNGKDGLGGGGKRGRIL